MAGDHGETAATPEWGDTCPDCGGAFPFLHGGHPTWVPCARPPGWHARTHATPVLVDIGQGPVCSLCILDMLAERREARLSASTGGPDGE
jgi:hypothetical protein